MFNQLFGEELVIKVTELIKQDRYSGKDFKIFFIECNKEKQTKGNLNKLVSNITKNKMAKVSIDKHGHYWQVSFAKEQVKTQTEFKPTILEESEPTVAELEKAMEALQTKDELDILQGRKRGAAEEGEITDPKRERISGVFEAEIAHDDPIYLEALRDTLKHFNEIGV